MANMVGSNPISSTGFSRATSKVKRRLIISVEAVEKQGKTHFGLSGPAPIGVLNMDIGLEGVVQKFADKEVYVSEYRLNVNGLDLKQTAEAANALWIKQVKDYRYSLKNHRTCIIDTGSEQLELLRIARTGHQQDILPNQHAMINAEYAKLIREAFESDCNLIMLHRIKAEYKTTVNQKSGKEISTPTGKLVRAGYSGIGYIVQAVCRMERKEIDGLEGEHFVCTIKDSRHNPSVNGMELVDEMCNFPTLASMLIEGTEPDEWE